MVSENTYYETGSCPYYIELNNTAKEYSFQESSNPRYGYLDSISNKTILLNDIIKEDSLIIQDYIIVKE